MTGLLILAAGAGAGVGLLLVWQGLRPARRPLRRLLADLDTTRPAPAPVFPVAVAAETGWAVRLGMPAAAPLARLGLPTAGTRAALAVLGRSPEAYLAGQATAAFAGLIGPAASAALLAVGGVYLGPILPAWACLILGGLAAATPTLSVRAEAVRTRTAWRQALSAFLDLVVIALAGGAGIQEALADAAQVGTGPVFAQLREVLDEARLTRTSPWQLLAALGDRLGVDELSDLAVTVDLAGSEGARIRASLAARAEGLRARELAEIEGAANSATERMSLPVVLLFAGFLVFLGFPAVAVIATGL